MAYSRAARRHEDLFREIFLISAIFDLCTCENVLMWQGPLGPQALLLGVDGPQAGFFLKNWTFV